MTMDSVSKESLSQFVSHCLEAAGNPQLMSKQVIDTLAEQAGGNFRTLTNLANELLSVAIKKNIVSVEELEVDESAPSLD